MILVLPREQVKKPITYNKLMILVLPREHVKKPIIYNKLMILGYLWCKLYIFHSFTLILLLFF